MGSEQPFLGDRQALLNYLRIAMAHRKTEEVRVLFRNAKHRLLSNEAMRTRTIDERAIHVREIVACGRDPKTAALALVHYRPSGDQTPSRPGIRLTQHFIAAARPLKIAIHDHLLIGDQGHASLRAFGHL